MAAQGTQITNFSAALEVIRDSRLRLAIAGSAVMLVMFAINFARIFLPAEIAAGDAQQDYAAFYGAAKAALAGAGGNLYEPRIFQEAIGAETTLLWLYPPPMLFVLAPFGFLPYGMAKLCWVAASLACAFAIGRLTTGSNAVGALTAISPAAFATLFVGQVSAFFALLLVSGMLLANKRPLLAGACFAVLTLKPQYGLLVIPFLIVTRAWKAMGAAAAFSILMILLSTAVFGAEMWRAFFDSLINGVHAAYYQSGGHPGRITLSDAIKASGLPAPPAYILYPPLIAASIAGLFMIAKTAPRPLTLAYSLGASALICPYLFVYDYFIFYAAILVAGVHMAQFKPLHAYALMALWFAPIVPFIGGSTVTPAFLWPISLLGVTVLFVLARRHSVTASL